MLCGSTLEIDIAVYVMATGPANFRILTTDESAGALAKSFAAISKIRCPIYKDPSENVLIDCLIHLNLKSMGASDQLAFKMRFQSHKSTSAFQYWSMPAVFKWP